ncbi:MAG: GNAT family N-acetyltransferase [Candidatus Hodarchaeota archaeon]
MVTQVPSSQFNSIRYMYDAHQHLRNVIDAIPELPLGKLFVDNPDNPSVSLFTIPGIHILSGNPVSSNIDNILALIPLKQTIVIPNQNLWIPHLKNFFGIRLGSFNRYAVSASTVSLEHIRNLKQELPDQYYLQKVDIEVLNQIKNSIGYYVHLLFGDPEHFMVSGIGYCIKNDYTIISMASSLVPFRTSLEIQVDTVNSPKYRRKGFATRVTVELIEYCLENGIEPHWDADTEISRDFALKLGYTNPQPYKCYYWI